MTDQTANLRLNKPVFNQPLWHDLVSDNWEIIDATVTTYLTISGIVGPWENSTGYVVGNKVIDTDTSSLYECAVNHTSAASPTTFEEDRQANPTYWSAPSIVARGLGSWTPSTPYEPNDFVIGTGNIFAVCIASHTSSSDFATDVAYWDYLLDLSTLGTLPAITGADANKYLRTNGTATASEWVAPSQIDTDLGLGSIVTQDANNVNITGGSIVGITDLAIVDGGTGASDAATAFGNLKQAATDAVTGVVEIATQAEVNTGSDTTRSLTPATLAGRPKFRVHKNGTNQTNVANATTTTITWSTESFDIGGYFSGNTWTPPAGIYVMHAVVELTGLSASTGYDVNIEKNGTIIATTTLRSPSTNGITFHTMTASSANGTDDFTVTVTSSEATNKTVQGNSDLSCFEGWTI